LTQLSGPALLPIIFLLSGCSVTYQWLQKLEIVVATPEGDLRASTVQRIDVTSDSTLFRKFIQDSGRRATIHGEALALKVSGERFLFVLLPDPHLAERTLDVPRNLGTKRLYRAIQSSIGQPSVKIAPEWRPLIVTFGSLSDPKSMELVDPENFAASFGDGYALTSLTLSIVDAQPTEHQIKTLLPWLEALAHDQFTILGQQEKAADKSLPDRAKYAIHPSSFSTGLLQ
jgi:hypothetical protein